MLEDNLLAPLFHRNREPLPHHQRCRFVVNDEAMGLLLAIGSIRSADGLQQIVILHGLIEIHHLKDWCIKSSQEFTRDNHELERVGRIAKPIKQLFFFLFAGRACFFHPGDR